MSRNATLRHLLEAVYRMAVRKREANRLRPDGEKYAELQRVRLGTRLPVYLPMRVDDELLDILRVFREKASAAGVRQFFIQTHFQSPLEVTPEAREAVRRLLSTGWSVTNQLVYNVAASRRGHTAKLRRVLNGLGVVCYYTFSVKGFEENYEVFAPNARSLQETQEEKTGDGVHRRRKTPKAKITVNLEDVCAQVGAAIPDDMTAEEAIEEIRQLRDLMLVAARRSANLAIKQLERTSASAELVSQLKGLLQCS